MRLVLEVGTDDIGLAGVARCERVPGAQPVRFGETVLAVPKVKHEAVVGLRVVVEDDHEVLASGLVNDDVHDLLRGLPCEFGVLASAVIDAAGRG